MALFDFLGNLFKKPAETSKIPDLSASIGSFAQKNVGFTPPAPPIPVIKGGISGFADLPKPGFDPFKPETFGRGGIAGPMDVFGGVRPIITTQLPTQSPVIPPEPPKTPVQIQQPIEKPFIPNLIAKSVINPAVQQFGGGTPTGGGISSAGTGAGASLAGTVSGLGQQGVGQPQEEKEKTKKQPQFQMVTLDQARQLGLQGTGQSGVFRDQAGNFYGISNAQVATQFGVPNAQGIQTVTPTTATPTLAPFQTSLATGPISADVLLKGVPDKLLPTYQQAFDDLNTQIQQNLQQQPPLPQQPVVETQEQQNFLRTSQDPYGLQSAMDQSRAKYGLPDLENQRINAMRTIQATNDALQKIVKDIQDNPDFPKGLANRMITDFTNKNAITLQNLQAQVGIIGAQIDQANEAVNREFGIKKFGVEQGISDRKAQQAQEEQARDNARQQVQQYISSGAFAEFSDTQLQSIANAKIGYDFSSLKTMRDALKSGNDRKIQEAQAKLDIQEERLKLAQEKAAKTTEGVFTNTQINSGAATAGLPITEFKQLDEDTKNFFINNSDQIKSKKKLIDEAKTKKEDPISLRNEIVNSSLPQAVKDTLSSYVKEVFPDIDKQEASKPWWQRVAGFFGF